MQKYEFTGEVKKVSVYDCDRIYGVDVRQVRAIRDFGTVHTGDIGGWISSEYNLSHTGTCWIGPNIAITENGMVLHDAICRGDGVISGRSLICENAVIDSENFQIHDCHLSGHSQITSKWFRNRAFFRMVGNSKISAEKITIPERLEVPENAHIRYTDDIVSLRISDDREFDDGRHLCIFPDENRNLIISSFLCPGIRVDKDPYGWPLEEYFKRLDKSDLPYDDKMVYRYFIEIARFIIGKHPKPNLNNKKGELTNE